jgi:DNA-binding transcriptional ArsR family regulator
MLNTLAALAEPTRLKIVEFLGTSPRSVGEICNTLSLRQPQASKHLRVLRDTGVVEVEARAQHRIYSLRAAPLRELSDWLERYRAIWDERLDGLDKVIEEMQDKARKHRSSRRKRRSR